MYYLLYIFANICNFSVDYTGCDIIDASQALSLDLVCENCPGSTIICPMNKNSVCNVNCVTDDSMPGCVGATMTTSNDSSVTLECVNNEACRNMVVNASFVNYISIICDHEAGDYYYTTDGACYGLNVNIPNIFNTSKVQCISDYSCVGLSLSLLTQDYEYAFTDIEYIYNFTAGDRGPGASRAIDLFCGSRQSYVWIQDKETRCGDWRCCPLTRKHIYCDTYDENEDCVINCDGNYENDKYESSILCAAQYIYGANKINCYGVSACNYMNVYTRYTSKELTIFCDSGISNAVYDFCEEMNIFIEHENTYYDTNIICYGDSCDAMNIYSDQDGIKDHLDISINYCEYCKSWPLENCTTSINLYCGIGGD